MCVTQSWEVGPAVPTLIWEWVVSLSSALFSQISSDTRKQEGKILREV